MKFILIVIVMANNNFEMASEQFATKSACDAAGKQVVELLGGDKAATYRCFAAE